MITGQATAPLVSICLPTLNSRRFLDERLDSIFQQTYGHWELIVVDGFSTDGTWEELQRCCAGDARVKLAQAPAQGVYPAIDDCVQRTSGDFIYIATADDTMVPECLAELVRLATEGPEPAVAQCGLLLIDESGQPLPANEQWPRNTEWHSAWSAFFEKAHRRPAPFDGAVVLLFGTTITSLTQALFPRAAFSLIGAMPREFGSAGDMAWEGALGFFHDVRYTPERLATWRYHSAQATRQAHPVSWLDRRVLIVEWIIRTVESRAPDLAGQCRRAGLGDYSRYWRIRCSASKGIAGRLTAMLRMITDTPGFYFRCLKNRATRPVSDPMIQTRLDCLERFLGRPVSDYFVQK